MENKNIIQKDIQKEAGRISEETCGGISDEIQCGISVGIHGGMSAKKPTGGNPERLRSEISEGIR